MEGVKSERERKRDAPCEPGPAGFFVGAKKAKTDSDRGEGEDTDAAAIETQIQVEMQQEAQRKNKQDEILERRETAIAESVFEYNKPLFAERRKQQGNTDESLNPRVTMDTINGREAYCVSNPASLGPPNTYVSKPPRPVTEPPVFNYEWYIEEHGFLEEIAKTHDRMYEPDIKFRTDRLDLVLERQLLTEYRDWAEDIKDVLARDNAELGDSNFMCELAKDLALEQDDVEEELDELEKTRQRRQEYENLDDKRFRKRSRRLDDYHRESHRRAMIPAAPCFLLALVPTAFVHI